MTCIQIKRKTHILSKTMDEKHTNTRTDATADAHRLFSVHAVAVYGAITRADVYEDVPSRNKILCGPETVAMLTGFTAKKPSIEEQIEVMYAFPATAPIHSYKVVHRDKPWFAAILDAVVMEKGRCIPIKFIRANDVLATRELELRFEMWLLGVDTGYLFHTADSKVAVVKPVDTDMVERLEGWVNVFFGDFWANRPPSEKVKSLVKKRKLPDEFLVY